MHRYFWQRFIGSTLIAFLSLSLSRLVFAINLNSYFESSLSEYASAFLFGLRFDVVVISYLLAPYFLATLFVKSEKGFLITKLYFFGVLALTNLLNCVDAEFFKFTARRSTDDLFKFAFLSDDLFNIAPNLLSTFWYLLVAFAFIMLISWLLYSLLPKPEPLEGKRWFATTATIVLLLIGARSGFQRIPLSIIDAGTTEFHQLFPVVLSTPFTILKTIGKPDIPDFEYAKDEISGNPPIVTLGNSSVHGELNGSNVVFIIAESLANEYIGYLNGMNHSYTPFVDSLCGKSLVFTNGFANGHRSIEAIAAISSSVPTLMYEPFSTSRYAENSVTSFASLLETQGYSSSFMHGGNKNSMNFESFALHAGFDRFYDRDDYPHPDEHYDGYWGISDHYFLNNCVELYSESEQPFVSGIFTLSSHHPYSFPKEFENRFPKGTLPIHESIGYADESLRQFFENAAKTDWYENTLFVITADHTSLTDQPYYQTLSGALRIPIIMFHPNDTILRGINQTTVQQIDIMPSVLDLLGYDEPFFCFGESAFDTTADHAVFAFQQDQYQIIHDDTLTSFDGQNITFVYDMNSDPLLRQNLVQRTNPDVGLLKNFLVNYKLALEKNKMTFEAWNGTRP